MSKFFRILMLMVSSLFVVASFSSCGKDDDDKEESSKEGGTYVIEFVEIRTNMVDPSTGKNLSDYLTQNVKSQSETEYYFDANSDSQATALFDEVMMETESEIKQGSSTDFMDEGDYMTFVYVLKKDGKNIATKTMTFSPGK